MVYLQQCPYDKTDSASIVVKMFKCNYSGDQCGSSILPKYYLCLETFSNTEGKSRLFFLSIGMSEISTWIMFHLLNRSKISLRNSLRDKKLLAWWLCLQILTLPPLRHWRWQTKWIQMGKGLWVIQLDNSNIYKIWLKETLLKYCMWLIFTGILTKPDLVDKGAEESVVNTVNNQVISLKKGYMIVKCRGQRDINEHLSLSKALQNEQVFFQEHPHFRQELFIIKHNNKIKYINNCSKGLKV